MTVLESAPSNVIGIDVFKDTLAVFDQSRQRLTTIRNEPEAIARQVASFDPDTLVV